MPNSTLDPDLAAIRDLMGTQPDVAPAKSQKAKSNRAKSQQDFQAETVSPEPQAAPQHPAKPRESREPRAPSRLKRLAGAVFQALRARLQAFLARPDAPRLMALMVLAAIFIWRPLFVIGLALFATMLALITYLSLGPDRVAQSVATWFARLKARDPDRAETLRARAARVSKVVAKVVARLPDSWTQGLYLPDFEEASEVPPEMHDDPFDRLVPQSELH